MKSTQDKLLEMLHLQDAINRKISENWRQDNRPWYRAIWIELAEFMGDHIGYKWWKHEQTDIEQAQIELVDIFHFGLSDLLNQEDAETIAARHATSFEYPTNGITAHETIRTLTEAFVVQSISDRHFDIARFVELAAAVDLSFDNLYRQYVGKNVLNHFRQTHGYKDGSYIKLWNGEEDNVVLARVVAALDSDSDDFAEHVEQGLSAAYAKVKA